MRTIEYDEDVAFAWSELLREVAEAQGAPMFAWHMAERGCAPDEVREMARRWRDEGFTPRDFAGEIDKFAEAIEPRLETGLRTAWRD